MGRLSSLNRGAPKTHPTVLDEVRLELTTPDAFKPHLKAVPPVRDVVWPKSYLWCANYCAKGLDGLSGHERDEIAFAINVPEESLAALLIEHSVVYALTALQYTEAAVHEFFTRAEVRMQSTPEQVGVAYNRALSQLRAIIATRGDLGMGLGAGVSHVVKSLAGMLARDYPFDELMRLVQLVNLMREAKWHDYESAQTHSPIMWENVRLDKLSLRVRPAAGLVNRWIFERSKITGRRGGEPIFPSISMKMLAYTMSLYRYHPPPYIINLDTSFEFERQRYNCTSMLRSYLILSAKVWDGIVPQSTKGLYENGAYSRLHKKEGKK